MLHTPSIVYTHFLIHCVRLPLHLTLPPDYTAFRVPHARHRLSLHPDYCERLPPPSQTRAKAPPISPTTQHRCIEATLKLLVTGKPTFCARMHDSSLSPPALSHSPLSGDEGGGEPSTSESTPLHTPKSVAAELHQPAKRERDLYFSWHRKQYASGRNDPSFPAPDWEHSEPLFESDFSLFPDPAPAFEKLNMGTTVEQRGGNSTDGIDINLPPRLSNSQSPRNQTSTLTAALEQAGASGQHVPDNSQYMGVPEPGRLSVSGRHDSISNMFGSSYLGSGARPISVKDRQRRESNTGGSFMGNGMSWGGISVGSLRDE